MPVGAGVLDGPWVTQKQMGTTGRRGVAPYIIDRKTVRFPTQKSSLGQGGFTVLRMPGKAVGYFLISAIAAYDTEAYTAGDIGRAAEAVPDGYLAPGSYPWIAG